jgi:hypothetical protein
MSKPFAAYGNHKTDASAYVSGPITTVNHSLLPAIGTANLPAKYEAAKTALAECDRVDECKTWADKSQALASYARQSKNKDLENMAMRIRARAIRRCGELLAQVAKQQGGDRKSKGHERPFDRKQAATEAGLSPRQAKDALRVAKVKPESFESQVESAKPPTVAKLAAQGKSPAKGVPLYEQLGMTKQVFQAGMYFRGDMEDYLTAMERHSPADVVAGSTKEERETIRRNIKLIEKYHDKLKGKL